MSLDELKRMMEVLGAPQTHIGLKQMIKEVYFYIFILVIAAFKNRNLGNLNKPKCPVSSIGCKAFFLL